MMKARLLYLSVVLLLLAACGPAAQQATATPAATMTSGSGLRATATQPPAVQPTTAPATQVTATPRPAATATPAGAKPKYGGVLRFNLRSEPTGTDPWVNVTYDVMDVFTYVHGRLTRTDHGSEPCTGYPLDPELATGWQWVDDTTLEISLRQGVRFPSGPPYNGREFTADDLVYSATVQWPRSSVFAATAERLKSVEKADKYKVRFKVKAPFADLLEITENPRLPIAGQDLFGPDNRMTRMEQVGLGPFRVSKYSPGISVDFTKNEEYWRKDLPYVAGLKGMIIPDFSTVAAAVRSSRLDFAELKGQLPLAQGLLQSNPELSFAWCQSVGFRAMYLPPDEPPFGDVRVRQAIGLAIDRDAVKVASYGETGLSAWSIVGPGLDDLFLRRKDYPPEIRQYLMYNPDKARSLLAEAGSPKGFEMTINVAGRVRDTLVSAEAISAMLEKVGIKVKLNVQEWGAFTATTRQGRYKGALIYAASDDMKSQLLDRHSSMPLGVNYGRVKDPGLDALLEEFERVLDVEKRKEVARRIQYRSVEQALIVPTGAPVDANVRQPWVKGIPPKFKAWVMSDYVMYGWLDR